MMDKCTARNGKMIINILVNSPIASVFLGSVDASNESTDSIKMYMLFEKLLKELGRKILYKLSPIMLMRMLRRKV